MRLNEIHNSTVKSIVRLALLKKYIVSVPKINKVNSKFKGGTPLRIRKENTSGIDILKYFLDNIEIKTQLNISLLNNSIIIYDDEN